MSDEPWSSWRAPVIAVIAAVAVLVIVPLVSRRGGSDEVRGLTLTVRVSDLHRVRTLVSGELVHPGDTLRFSVRSDQALLTVVGVDGGGQARVVAGPLQADAGEHELPGELVLDASLGQQRYVAFACVLPVSADALRAAAAAERPGVEGCTLDVVTAQKLPP